MLGRVGLGPWINELHSGFDTDIGTGGEKLSGGQRRRLALAQALLADFETIILDEPTAHIDAASAGTILGDLIAAAAGRGILVLSHTVGDPSLFGAVVPIKAEAQPEKSPAQR